MASFKFITSLAARFLIFFQALWYHRRSTAKSIHIRNSSGPKTEPWGTPLITSTQCEQQPLTVTLICLSSKKDDTCCTQMIFVLF